MYVKLVISICVCYLIALFSFYIYTNSFELRIQERVFTTKDFNDGPLVMKEHVVVKGKGNVITANVILNTNLFFDQPDDGISMDKKLKDSLSMIDKDFENLLVNLGTDLSNFGENLIYFTFINAAFERLTLNWMCNVADFGTVLERLLIVTTKESICKRILKEWPSVTCTHLPAPSRMNSAAHWGSDEYINLLTLRMQMINILVQGNVAHVVIEADSVWLRDPSEFFVNFDTVEDADIVVPVKSDTSKWDVLSFDPMIVFPTNATLVMIKELYHRLAKDASLYDQDVLNELCQKQFQGIACRRFEWNEVADGKWFKMSDSERRAVNPYVVNNNYYVGVDNKENRQAINGFWFINRRGVCNREKVKKILTRYMAIEVITTSTAHNISKS